MTAERARLAEDRNLLRWLWGLAAAGVLLILFAEARAVTLRYFVNDDYMLLYTGWLRFQGKVAPADFGIQSFHVLPDAIALAFRLWGARIETAFIVRFGFWALLLAVPVLAALLARKVFPAPCAPFAAVLSLASWPVLERGLDIRPDLILTVLWLGLLLLAAGPPATWRRHALIGAGSALALVIRIKAGLFLPVLALLLLKPFVTFAPLRVTGRALARALAAWACGAAGVATLFALFLLRTGQVGYFLKGTFVLGQIAHTGSGHSGIFLNAFGLLLRHDPLLALLLGAGLIQLFRKGAAPGGALLAYGLLALGLVLPLANPAFYSYNFVTLLPLLSPLMAAGCLWAAERLPTVTTRRTAALGLMALVLAIHGPMVGRLATKRTNAHQLAFAHALGATAPGTSVFAMEGLGLFRPSTYDWRLSAVSLPLYQHGVLGLNRQLRAAVPEVLVTSYRVPGWLMAEDQQWLFAHYGEQAPNVFVLSVLVTPAAPHGALTLARAQPFEVQGAPCRVDGEVRAPGAPFLLSPGTHPVDAQGGESLVHFHWPAVTGLRGYQDPYLFSPEQCVYEEPES